MAAHDDKISTNRRRLFKALSSVPVVMTLRPGSALANTSAYQCLADGKISNWHKYDWPHINMPCPNDGGTACYAYEYRNYINAKEGTAVSGVSCIQGLHHILIEVGGDGSESYLDFNGNMASSYVGVDPADNALRVLINGSGDVCKTGIPVRRGLFAVVGHADEGKTTFTVDGVFPEYRIEDTNGYQGITGTCMNSIVGVTPQTLSRG